VLDCIGEIVGGGPVESVDQFLEVIADERTVGGWVVIGKALGAQLDHDLEVALKKCRGYIIAADVWHGADTLAERVLGPALVKRLDLTLDAIQNWRDDTNHWVRRAIGTAVHYWGKRAQGSSEHQPDVESLLDFIEPLFEERETKVVKGVGWGLKTLGKYYPQMTTNWLTRQLILKKRQPRKLMLNKAMTYLAEEQRQLILSQPSA
jgi:3-methyladenine DNA glycosylase AlkD